MQSLKKLLAIILVISISVSSPFAVKYLIDKHKKHKDVEKEMTIQQMHEETIKIHNKLRLVTGVHNLPLYFLPLNIVNAWTDGKKIVVTDGLLKFVKGDENQIALILAHEMSHDLLHHLSNYDPTLSNVEKEAQADKLGAFIMLRAGYDICKGRVFFLNLMNYEDGDFADPFFRDHPSDIYRYHDLDMPWCGEQL